VPPASEEEAGWAEGPGRPFLIDWLGVAEVVFGVAFVLLATLTIVLTLRRLRSR
jgi:hypothetical protein